MGELRRLYRRHLTTASDPVTRLTPVFGVFSPEPTPGAGKDYRNFTEVNPLCNLRHAAIQLRRARLFHDRTPGPHPRPGRLRGAISPMARIAAPNIEETIMLRKLSLVAVAAAS